MNQKEWRLKSRNKNKEPNFWYWRNKAIKYFNLQKGQVIHHLRDTEEQCIFNDKYYERWGFDFNEKMKYCICISKEEHLKIHSISEDTRKRMSESAKKRECPNKGRITYNNGEKMIRLKPDDPIPEGFKKGLLLTANRFGHHPTKEAIEKQWKTKKEKGTDKKSSITRRKMSEAAKKYKKTELHLQHIKEAAKKRKGQIPWNKGKKMSKDFCEKVSKYTKIAMNTDEVKAKLKNRNKRRA